VFGEFCFAVDGWLKDGIFEFGFCFGFACNFFVSGFVMVSI